MHTADNGYYRDLQNYRHRDSTELNPGAGLRKTICLGTEIAPVPDVAGGLCKFVVKGLDRHI